MNTDDVLAGQASWRVPPQRGIAPAPRGYHAACVVRVGGNTTSPATVMLVAGGMCLGRSMLDLAMVDLNTVRDPQLEILNSNSIDARTHSGSGCPSRLLLQARFLVAVMAAHCPRLIWLRPRLFQPG